MKNQPDLGTAICGSSKPTTEFPVSVLPAAKAFCRRYRLALGLLLLVAFKLWLVHTEDIYGSATEFDALWFVGAAKHWYWGSPYSWTAFVRPPAYPLFIAFVHLLHVPLRIGIELMDAAGYLAVVAGLRKAGAPVWVCLAGYAAMSLHPGSYQLNSVTMADNFYAAVLPLALGGLLLTLLTARLIHASWTGFALALLWNTREESILIPPMIGVFLIVALIRQRLVMGSWKPAMNYWLKPAGVMMATLLLLNLAVLTANYRAFQSFSKSEMTASTFKAAHKALLRIKPERVHRYISVSTDALRKAYSVSPTFARLQPELEGDLGRGWQVQAVTTLGLHEIGGSWILWTLRHAAERTGGIHDSAASAKRFYRNVAKEINRACDEGRIPSRFVLSSFLDPVALAHIGSVPQSFPTIFALFATQYHTFDHRDDDILTESQHALYDEMTNRGPTWRQTSPLGISTRLENFIGYYHRFFVIVLSVAGGVAALAIAVRFRQLRAGDPINAALLLSGATILLRVLLFTYLDATWWSGGYERYLFPVLPLYSCFLILLIYQSLALWHRTARTDPRSGGL